MSMFTLTNGPTIEMLEAIRKLMASKDGSPTAHWSFPVYEGDKVVSHPNAGINRTPKLRVRFVEIPESMRLVTQQRPLMTVEVVEDFEGGELPVNGVDAGKAGTQLSLQYFSDDCAAEIKNATVKAGK